MPSARTTSAGLMTCQDASARTLYTKGNRLCIPMGSGICIQPNVLHPATHLPGFCLGHVGGKGGDLPQQGAHALNEVGLQGKQGIAMQRKQMLIDEGVTTGGSLWPVNSGTGMQGTFGVHTS
jgi:hypothetical protein